jgi:glycosyltransferase involved in cell wall biosynthesis
MMASALNEFQAHPKIRLEVRGRNPWWPTAFRQEMREKKLWHDYAPRAELEEWLSQADALLVPMVFDARLRQRMETSFPSKMVEMAQLGKPLVVWGPDYASAIKWARHENRALCVTDENPLKLRQALEALADSRDEQQRLAQAAQAAARTDFNPDRIQQQFMASLQRVAGVR